MEKLKNTNIYQWIGYGLTVVYVLAAAWLLIKAAGLDMLPGKYLLIIGILLAILAAVFLIMHERFLSSVIASLLTVAMTVLCVLGSSYIKKTDHMIAEVTSADTQTNVMALYVMDKDPAEKLEDVKDYKVGMSFDKDEENTKKAAVYFEEQLGSELKTKECKTMFTMMNDLKQEKLGAVLLNEAYTGIISDVEGFEWVDTDIRKIASMEIEVEQKSEAKVPDSVPETFVMYLSGIDTYGGISARSRSDVNILAVVNIQTKDILLLSTPRDAYVSYSETGGEKDKLTHAGIYGIDASMDALEQLYGIDINYYLRVNFTGFMDIIDALGGIEVNSDYEFTVQNIKTYHKGLNKVTGIEALAFARERYSFKEGDYQRAKNQMEVIRAVVQKCASSSLLRNYGSVMNAIGGSFETNMPDEQISELVKMQLSDMSQWNISSYTTNGTSRHAETYSMPGQSLYVIDLDEKAVEKAKELIQEVYQGKE